MSIAIETEMSAYEDVNKEIQNLLASKKRHTHSREPAQTAQENILPLLEMLNKTYNEINTYLKIGDSEGLKDIITKSDIKMSMVCETLLETLAKTTAEKNKLLEENNKLERLRRELEEKIAKLTVQVSKEEDERLLKTHKLSELERIIQDQKSRLCSYKEEIQEMKNSEATIRYRMREIESLKSKALERIELHETEMKAAQRFINERDDAIERLRKEKKDEENKNGEIKTRIPQLERTIEMLQKRVEMKEENLSLCNNELSKVLTENKFMKQDYERHKEGHKYYESLYNNVNKQNAYLNDQLSKMLREKEFLDNPDECIEKYRKKLRRNKKRLLKLRKLNERLEKENSEMCEEKKRVEESSMLVTGGNKLNNDGREYDSSDLENIIKRIEELTTKNKEYKEKIDKLEKQGPRVVQGADRMGGLSRANGPHSYLAPKDVQNEMGRHGGALNAASKHNDALNAMGRKANEFTIPVNSHCNDYISKEYAAKGYNTKKEPFYLNQNYNMDKEPLYLKKNYITGKDPLYSKEEFSKPEIQIGNSDGLLGGIACNTGPNTLLAYDEPEKEGKDVPAIKKKVFPLEPEFGKLNYSPEKEPGKDFNLTNLFKNQETGFPLGKHQETNFPPGRPAEDNR